MATIRGAAVRRPRRGPASGRSMPRARPPRPGAGRRPTNSGRPTTISRPSTVARTPWPAIASKPVTSGSSIPLSRTCRTIASPSGCSEPRSAAATRARRSPSPGRLRPANDVRHARLALGQRAGLVEDDRPDLVEPLERLGVAEQDAVLGALARPDHDRGRRGQPQGARAGDDQDRRSADEGQVEGRRRPEEEPDDEGEARDRQHDRHEDARRPRPPAAGSGARDPWASWTSRTIWARSGVGPDPCRP